MNTTQIKCFLALAKALNFTKAAEQLYMSQPGLSRQISTMERDLNTQLFIRDQKSVRLSPAGALLAQELGDIETAYENLIARVQSVGMGYSGSLTLGILEGQWVGAEFTDFCRRFMDSYPNIDFQIQQGSFSDLRRMLTSGEIDIAMTIQFDIADMEGIVTRRYDSDHAVFAVSRRLPLGQKEHITFDDLLDGTFLLISPEDSRTGTELTLEHFRKLGRAPRRIRYAPNLSTMMLWIESGLGVGVINHQSSVASNPSVRLIDEVPLKEANACVAWKKENLNPAIALFDQALINRTPE